MGEECMTIGIILLAGVIFIIGSCIDHSLDRVVNRLDDINENLKKLIEKPS